jgi:pimeloyl-ACP methyl ester carboxylesterase
VLSLAEPDRAELVEVNRTTLRLWCWGDPGAPPVVLVHGAYDHGRMFDGIAPRLAALGYHAVAVDLRGHGDSGPLDTGWAWGLLHLDLALLIRERLGGGPVGFVAHSFGGGQACGVAGAFPELVRWLVNIDGLGPPAEVLGPPPDIGEMVERSFAAMDRARGERRPWASLDEMAARRRQNNPRLPETWTLHLARHGARRARSGEGWVWKADAMFGVGFPGAFDAAMLEAELRAVRCPVLALTGDQEDTWRELDADELATRVGWFCDGRHRVIPGTGHYPHVEDPAATMTHIEAFLAEVGP